MIQGLRWRLRCRDDGPAEFVTTREASAEEDEPEESTKTTQLSAEEAEETTRPSEPLQRRRQRCVNSSRILRMTTVSSAEEDAPEDLVTKTEALAEDKE